jgi:hypothetical protein
LLRSCLSRRSNDSYGSRPDREPKKKPLIPARSTPSLDSGCFIRGDRPTRIPRPHLPLRCRHRCRHQAVGSLASSCELATRCQFDQTAAFAQFAAGLLLREQLGVIGHHGDFCSDLYAPRARSVRGPRLVLDGDGGAPSHPPYSAPEQRGITGSDRHHVLGSGRPRGLTRHHSRAAVVTLGGRKEDVHLASIGVHLEDVAISRPR